MSEVKVPWKTPLRQSTGDALAGRELFDAEDRFIAETFGTPEASGEEMCIAVRDALNSHARLVECLGELLSAVDQIDDVTSRTAYPDYYDALQNAANKARTLIKELSHERA